MRKAAGSRLFLPPSPRAGHSDPRTRRSVPFFLGIPNDFRPVVSTFRKKWRRFAPTPTLLHHSLNREPRGLSKGLSRSRA